MIVLAIDTAGTACNVALYESARATTLSVAGADIGRGHAERLMAFIDEALAIAGLEMKDLDRIAVTIGPGSFTGIRVGVAAARGLALALSIPVVGISVLQALAVGALRDGQDAGGQDRVLVVTDAKRDEVYLQLFDGSGVPIEDAAALSVEEARARFGAFDGLVTGSGTALLAETLPAEGETAGQSRTDTANITIVASLGAKADPATALPKPLYLRGPDVRSQAGFAVALA